MLFTTLFFAFAHFYPEEIIYVFFILPLKVKWIAWAYAGFLLLGFATQSNSYRLALMVALSNYLVFFGPGVIRHLRQRKEVAVRRQRFEIQSRSDEEPLHRCATCGATEANAIPVSSSGWREMARNIASRIFRDRPTPPSDGKASRVVASNSVRGLTQFRWPLTLAR